MTNKKILTLVFFALVFAFTLVSAFNVETNLITNVVCPSATIVLEEKITASEASTFEVIVSGSASSFATALPIGFELGKGESKSVYIYLTPPSSTLPGKYNLLVTIKGEGTSKTLSKEIIVENCNELALNVETAKEVCGCEAVEYVAKIKNNGLYNERYVLELMGEASEFAKLSTDKISLDSGEEKEIKITFEPPCNIAARTYDFTLKATSLDSRAIATANGNVKVKNCFSYTLDAEKNYYRVCDGDEVNIVFNLRNRGVSDNFYEINFKGPKFAHADKNSITLNAGSEGEINVFVAPKLGEKPGNYSIEIETFSEKGKIIAKETATVEVVECHNAALNFMSERKEDRICNALENTYGIEIKNTGQKLADFVLSVDGPEWATLSNTSIALEPGQTKTIWLKVAPPYGTESKKYSIEVNAEDRNSELKISDAIKIETLTKEECYRPKIEAEENSIEVEKDKTHVVILTIENTGAQPATYIIDASGNANRFVSINPTIISLAPQEAENIYVYVAPSLSTPKGKYALTISARLNDSTILASKTIEVEVKEKTSEEVITPTGEAIKEVEEKKEKKSIWQRIADWFRKLFKREKKEENVINVTNVANITEVAEVSNVSEVAEANKTEEQVEQADNESEVKEKVEKVENVGEAKSNESNQSVTESELASEILQDLVEGKQESGITKYRWIIIGVLAFIAFILLLSIFEVWDKIFGAFRKKKKARNNRKKVKEESSESE